MSESLISINMIPSILDSIHSGIIAVNADGKVIICNAAADKMLGVDFDVSGMYINSFVSETKMFEVINSGQGHYGKRFCFRDKTFVVNRTPIVDSFSAVIGAVAVFQDVTDLEEIAKELESFNLYITAFQIHRASPSFFLIIPVTNLIFNWLMILCILKNLLHISLSQILLVLHVNFS